MTDAGDKQDAIWPLPKFYFIVVFGDGQEARFLEVGGIETETTPIEYRHGDNPSFYPIKMPGLGKVGNVTLRKGIFAKDAEFRDWFSEIGMNKITRRAVVVRLLDETGAARMTWTLHNAWPTKITGTDLQSEGNEIAVESVEIAFETLTVTHA